MARPAVCLSICRERPLRRSGFAKERGYVVWQSRNGMEAVPYKWLTADGGDELLYLTGALKFG